MNLIYYLLNSFEIKDVCFAQILSSSFSLSALHLVITTKWIVIREKQGKIEGRPLNGRIGLMKSHWLKGSPGVKTAWMADSNKNDGALKQWGPYGSA